MTTLGGVPKGVPLLPSEPQEIRSVLLVVRPEDLCPYPASGPPTTCPKSVTLHHRVPSPPSNPTLPHRLGPIQNGTRRRGAERRRGGGTEWYEYRSYLRATRCRVCGFRSYHFNRVRILGLLCYVGDILLHRVRAVLRWWGVQWREDEAAESRRRVLYGIRSSGGPTHGRLGYPRRRVGLGPRPTQGHLGFVEGEDRLLSASVGHGRRTDGETRDLSLAIASVYDSEETIFRRLSKDRVNLILRLRSGPGFPGHPRACVGAG